MRKIENNFKEAIMKETNLFFSLKQEELKKQNEEFKKQNEELKKELKELKNKYRDSDKIKKRYKDCKEIIKGISEGEIKNLKIEHDGDSRCDEYGNGGGYEVELVVFDKNGEQDSIEIWGQTF